MTARPTVPKPINATRHAALGRAPAGPTMRSTVRSARAASTDFAGFFGDVGLGKVCSRATYALPFIIRAARASRELQSRHELLTPNRVARNCELLVLGLPVTDQG